MGRTLKAIFSVLTFVLIMGFHCVKIIGLIMAGFGKRTTTLISGGLRESHPCYFHEEFNGDAHPTASTAAIISAY